MGAFYFLPELCEQSHGAAHALGMRRTLRPIKFDPLMTDMRRIRPVRHLGGLNPLAGNNA
jgi:hypothetical protein